MSNKKELLLFLLIILLFFLILSQILIVYKVRYDNKVLLAERRIREFHDFDLNLKNYLAKNVIALETNNKLIQNEINARKMADILKEVREYSEQINNNNNNNNNTNIIPSNNDFNRKNEENMNTTYAAEKYRTNDEVKFVHNHLPFCSLTPNNLVGPLNISIDSLISFSKEQIFENVSSDIKLGGYWRPENCVSRHRVAVIIPYRDREEHLNVLLSMLHNILPRQLLDYRIYVIEQTGNDTFNKAQLMNAGFLEASRQYDYHCYIFHDVDLIPEDDRNLYSCSSQPKHLSVAIDEMNYRLAYKELVGGVFNIRKEHFLTVNGYSNLYWGWGAEDDDMAYRILYNGLRITRPPFSVAKYKMIKHTKRKPSDYSKRTKLLYSGLKRLHMDGLNSINHTLHNITYHQYYTKILVNVDKETMLL